MTPRPPHPPSLHVTGMSAKQFVPNSVGQTRCWSQEHWLLWTLSFAYIHNDEYFLSTYSPSVLIVGSSKRCRMSNNRFCPGNLVGPSLISLSMRIFKASSKLQSTKYIEIIEQLNLLPTNFHGLYSQISCFVCPSALCLLYLKNAWISWKFTQTFEVIIW